MKDIKKELKSLNFSADQLETGVMVLDLAQKFALEIEPMAGRFDEEGVHCENGQIILPSGMDEILQKMGASGIFGTFIPEQYGGGGLPYTFYVASIEIIAAACPCIAVAMAVHGTAIDSIIELGTQEARKKYLPKLAKGEMLGAAFLKDQGNDFLLDSSMAKLFSSEIAKQVADEALQIHGGYGYIREYEIERHYRDARITTIYEGTSEIQRVIISREILARE